MATNNIILTSDRLDPTLPATEADLERIIALYQSLKTLAGQNVNFRSLGGFKGQVQELTTELKELGVGFSGLARDVPKFLRTFEPVLDAHFRKVGTVAANTRAVVASVGDAASIGPKHGSKDADEVDRAVKETKRKVKKSLKDAGQAVEKATKEAESHAIRHVKDLAASWVLGTSDVIGSPANLRVAKVPRPAYLGGSLTSKVGADAYNRWTTQADTIRQRNVLNVGSPDWMKATGIDARTRDTMLHDALLSQDANYRSFSNQLAQNARGVLGLPTEAQVLAGKANGLSKGETVRYMRLMEKAAKEANTPPPPPPPPKVASLQAAVKALNEGTVGIDGSPSVLSRAKVSAGNYYGSVNYSNDPRRYTDTATLAGQIKERNSVTEGSEEWRRGFGLTATQSNQVLHSQKLALPSYAGRFQEVEQLLSRYHDGLDAETRLMLRNMGVTETQYRKALRRKAAEEKAALDKLNAQALSPLEALKAASAQYISTSDKPFAAKGGNILDPTRFGASPREAKETMEAIVRNAPMTAAQVLSRYGPDPKKTPTSREIIQMYATMSASSDASASRVVQGANRMEASLSKVALAASQAARGTARIGNSVTAPTSAFRADTMLSTTERDLIRRGQEASRAGNLFAAPNSFIGGSRHGWTGADALRMTEERDSASARQIAMQKVEQDLALKRARDAASRATTEANRQARLDSKAAAGGGGGGARALREVTDGTKQYKGALHELHSAMRGVTGASGALFLTYGSMIPLVGGYALTNAVKGAVAEFARLDQQLKFSQAVAEDYGATMQEARDSVGRTAVRFGAGPMEVAQAMQALTQAGVGAQEALSMVNSVLALATTGELDAKDAAVSLAGATQAFGYSFAESGRVADVFAKAAAISSTSVQAITESMKQASTVARGFGMEVEDVGVLLAALGKQNITGSPGGTAFRNALMEAVSPKGTAKKWHEELGITMFNPETGNMKDFLGTYIPQLREALGKLDTETRSKAMADMYNERGRKMIDVLVKESQTKIDSMLRDMYSAPGYTQEVAYVKNDNLMGDWKKLTAQWAVTKVEAGSAGEIPLRKSLQELRDLIKSKDFQEGFAAIITGVATLAKFTTSAVVAITNFTASLYNVAGSLGTVVTMLAMVNGGKMALRALLLTALPSLTQYASGVGQVGTLLGTAGNQAAAAGVGAAAAATKVGLLSRAMGLMGGPIGIVISGITAIVALYQLWQREMDKNPAKKMRDQMEESGKTTAELRQSQEEQYQAALGAFEQAKTGKDPVNTSVFIRDIQATEASVRSNQIELLRVKAQIDQLRDQLEATKEARAAGGYDMMGGLQSRINTLTKEANKYDEAIALGTQHLESLTRNRDEYIKKQRAIGVINSATTRLQTPQGGLGTLEGSDYVDPTSKGAGATEKIARRVLASGEVVPVIGSPRGAGGGIGEDLGTYGRPFASAYSVTSEYQLRRRNPKTGVMGAHLATDFGTPMGTPVRAMAEGIIESLWYDKKYGGGLSARVRHADGSKMGIAHLSKYAEGLKVGDLVSKGQDFAYTGNTGTSTGPHAHVTYTDPRGRKLDVTSVIGTGMGKGTRDKIQEAAGIGPTIEASNPDGLLSKLSDLYGSERKQLEATKKVALDSITRAVQEGRIVTAQQEKEERLKVEEPVAARLKSIDQRELNSLYSLRAQGILSPDGDRQAQQSIAELVAQGATIDSDLRNAKHDAAPWRAQVDSLKQVNEGYADWIYSIREAEATLKREADQRVELLGLSEYEKTIREAQIRATDRYRTKIDELRLAIEKITDKGGHLTGDGQAQIERAKEQISAIERMQQEAVTKAEKDARAIFLGEKKQEVGKLFAEALASGDGETVREWLYNEIIKKPFLMKIQALIDPVMDQLVNAIFPTKGGGGTDGSLVGGILDKVFGSEKKEGGVEEVKKSTDVISDLLPESSTIKDMFTSSMGWIKDLFSGMGNWIGNLFNGMGAGGGGGGGGWLGTAISLVSSLFAGGGIMSSYGPVELRRYANGGVASTPQLAMFGEGTRPEAYVPLPDGRSIPVTMSGAMGGGGNVNNVSISVRVDSNGNASAATNSEKGAADFGRIINQAVTAAIQKEQRAGGLLYGTQR